MKALKTLGILILIVFTSVLISFFSREIRMGTDKSDEATLGIKTHWGFPIPFVTTAPGYTWAHYRLNRFVVNTVLWCGAVTAAWMTLRRRSVEPKSKGDGKHAP